ncbi:MAG: GNAT family N-acetyltransferase [Clostridium sp.]|nr:GNAT family N-acetyltransferase [Clostridium sp.]
MNIKICKFNELTVKEMYEIAKSRFEVFAMEQKIIQEPELDGKDEECYHVFYKDNNKVVAYCRIVPSGVAYENTSIGRVLVLSDYRRKGLAQVMIKEALKFIKEKLDEQTVVLSGQVYAKGLYESVGFKQISDVYNEVDIPHIKMKIEL